jgi:hypothetical protein
MDEDAAAGIAGTDEVRVAVPDLRRIDAFPGALHQLVFGKASGKIRVARIPEALLRPIAPGSRAGGRRYAQSPEAQLPTQASSLCSP